MKVRYSFNSSRKVPRRRFDELKFIEHLFLYLLPNQIIYSKCALLPLTIYSKNNCGLRTLVLD